MLKSMGIARRNHRLLAPLGPNDGGGVLLADACRWPGALYPVWGADHFMRPPGGVEETVARVLTAACSADRDSTPWGPLQRTGYSGR